MADRGYQYDFTKTSGAVSFDQQNRERKARTIVAVIRDFVGNDLGELNVLDVGASTGFLDNFLADYFGRVTGIDIDTTAIEFAQRTHQKPNLVFETGDAMSITKSDASVDVVVCTQVYEHVPDAGRMMREIERVLKPGGICYFAAGNRFAIEEHHHHLPFLSAIPRPLGHLYLRIAGKGTYYYEKHLSYWGLKKLVRNFALNDYTRKIIDDPQKFMADYMVKPGTLKSSMASFLAKYVYWLVPGYIWILKKHS